MRKLLFYALILLLSMTSLFSVLGYFGKYNWRLDLFSHFKWQYLIILLVGTPILYFIRKKYSYLFMLFIVALLFEVLPLFWGGNKAVELTESAKVVCINLLSSNGQYKEVGNYIRQKDPEIVILQEFNALWKIKLEPNLNDYLYRITIPRGDNFGIAVYSKIKQTQLASLQIGDAGVPSVLGEIKLGKSKIKFIATHPLPPVDNWYFNNRNKQLSELSEIVSSTEEEVFVIGDLNTSSFSIHFKHLLSKGKLIDSRRGFGLLPSWPTWLSIMETTLDHCLVSKGISIKDRGVGPNIGSDHLPIFVELGLK